MPNIDEIEYLPFGRLCDPTDGRCDAAQGRRRMPAWNWRLAAIFIEDARSITVTAVGNRKEIYG
jgi:hypothetical protein